MASAPPPAIHGARATVLIVDDLEEMRSLARYALEADGRWTIAGEASDGLVAIECAADLQPDLVLLDLEMPWMAGAEAVPHILRVAPGCCVAVWTADPHGARARSAVQLGAAAVIGKGETPVARLGDRLIQVREECAGAVHRSLALPA